MEEKFNFIYTKLAKGEQLTDEELKTLVDYCLIKKEIFDVEKYGIIYTGYFVSTVNNKYYRLDWFETDGKYKECSFDTQPVKVIKRERVITEIYFTEEGE